jgi:hypothetical protein
MAAGIHNIPVVLVSHNAHVPMISYAMLKEICGVVKRLAESVGWMAAATFFVYRIGSGYLISGLSVKVRSHSINIKGNICVSVSSTLGKEISAPRSVTTR